ncbi:MAG TPA: ABC transporter ATP-binding protein [Candidatus Hydrogenedentes bacterium]|nr:ABC transporter ATP-binding protein [Candidatus Hydrogenedentota bacterium]
MPLLDVRNLTVTFDDDHGSVPVVEKVTFTLEAGKTLALVGESGCGKTMTALALMDLLPFGGRMAGGEILFDGQDLATLTARERRRLGGRRIAMIFQEPMTAMNPVYPVGAQIAAVLRLHREMERDKAWAEAINLMRRVGIADAEHRARQYPHQMSGGMLQRVMIAMAISCRPSLLIADEPTTALDVTVQAQILALLTELREEYGMALLLITHDLGVVAETADTVAVMYAGRIVEMASVETLIRAPRHPYSAGLLAARTSGEARRFTGIPGSVPRPGFIPPGCPFHPRCGRAMPACTHREPDTRWFADGSGVACWLHEPEQGEGVDWCLGDAPGPETKDAPR